MALANRVKETSTTTGTGPLDLDGAETNFQTFVAGLGESTGDAVGPWTLVPYLIILASAGEWEMGIGTVTDGTPDTLTRSPISSSNSGSLVNFSAGTKVVSLSPSYQQYPRMWVVTMDLSADESVAAGATEDMANFVAALDPHSLVSSGQVTAPFDAYMQHLATYFKDDATGGTPGVVPNLKIDGVGDQYDYSGLSFTAPDASFVQSAGRWFSVDKDDVIVPQGTNSESDASNDLEAGSVCSFLFIERFS